MEERKVVVDFNSKEEARTMGVRYSGGEWFAKGAVESRIAPRDDSRRVLTEFVTGLQNSNKQECVEGGAFEVPEECLCSEQTEHKWKKLLSFRNWNALVALTYIHDIGLPRESEERAMMLRYFATARPGEQYIADYESILAYCESFRKAYGWDILNRMQKEYRIFGYDFNASMNRLEIPYEVRMLFLFAFPLSVKTTVKEKRVPTLAVRRETEKIEAEKQLAMVKEREMECEAL